MDAKIDARTTKNHEKIEFAFFAILGRPFSLKGLFLGIPFWSHFRAKVENLHPNIDAKIDAEKVSNNDAKIDQK